MIKSPCLSSVKQMTQFKKLITIRKLMVTGKTLKTIEIYVQHCIKHLFTKYFNFHKQKVITHRRKLQILKKNSLYLLNQSKYRSAGAPINFPSNRTLDTDYFLYISSRTWKYPFKAKNLSHRVQTSSTFNRNHKNRIPTQLESIISWRRVIICHPFHTKYLLLAQTLYFCILNFLQCWRVIKHLKIVFK